jgi:hypothetical protein
MTLPADLVRCTFESELERSRYIAEKAGFVLDADVEALTVRAVYKAPDGHQFILTGLFDDYKARPPRLDFEEPGTGRVGTKSAYPVGHDSFFHPQPIICAPFNRKAYAEVHTDWPMPTWMDSTTQNVNWRDFSTMASMLLLVHKRISDPTLYRGRMAALG